MVMPLLTPWQSLETVLSLLYKGMRRVAVFTVDRSQVTRACIMHPLHLGIAL